MTTAQSLTETTLQTLTSFMVTRISDEKECLLSAGSPISYATRDGACVFFWVNGVEAMCTASDWLRMGLPVGASKWEWCEGRGLIT